MSNDLSKVQSQLNSIEKHLRLAREALKEYEKHSTVSYEEVPGIEGTFDGAFMVTEAGEKFEVPANYAAKSKILFGDKLKMIQENDRNLFKQVGKQKAKRVEGILSKKEGKWYLLADSGSYKISDTAAEYNGAQPHLEAVGLIPEGNVIATFAALEKVVKPEGDKADKGTDKAQDKTSAAKNESSKVSTITSSVSTKSYSGGKSAVSAQAPSKLKKEEVAPKEKAKPVEKPADKVVKADVKKTAAKPKGAPQGDGSNSQDFQEVTKAAVLDDDDLR